MSRGRNKEDRWEKALATSIGTSLLTGAGMSETCRADCRQETLRQELMLALKQHLSLLGNVLALRLFD